MFASTLRVFHANWQQKFLARRGAPLVSGKNDKHRVIFTRDERLAKGARAVSTEDVLQKKY